MNSGVMHPRRGAPSSRAGAALLLAALAGCGAELPRIEKFAPEPAVVDEGLGSFLRWEAPGATRISIVSGGVSVAESDQASGAVEVRPESSTSYELIARNDAGTVSALATIEVRRTPRIRSFNVSPARVKTGDEVTIAWITEHALAIDIFDGERNLPLDPAITSGSTKLKVDRPMTLKLTARTETLEVSQEAKVDFVGPPVIHSFASFPAAIVPGEKSALAWSVSGADTLVLTDDSGRKLPIGVRGLNDSYEVGPSATTGYTLTATGYGGETSAATSVRVGPAITSFKADVPAQAPGGQVTLSWKSAGASSVVLERGGQPLHTVEGAAASDGSFTETVPPDAQGAVSWTLVATGDGEARQTLELPVGEAPVFISARAETPAVLSGGTPTFLWETTGAQSLSIRSEGKSLTNITSQSRLASGSYTAAAITADTSYELQLKSSSGVVVTRAITVRVVAAPQIATFTATPSPAPTGGSVVDLSWTASDATEAWIEEEGGPRVFTTTAPNLARSGLAKVRPGTSARYVLTVRGDSGHTDSRTLAVPVTTPLPFTASPDPLLAGELGTLSWDVGSTGAQRVRISPVPFAVGSAAFEELSATGTPLVFADGDDALATFTVPAGFALTSGGSARTVLTVSTNGWVGLAPQGYSASAPTNAPLEGGQLDDVIAAFWDDLMLGSGAVLWEVRGTAADRRLLISFEGVALKTGSGSSAAPDGSLRFQVVLFENGNVELRYDALTATDPARALGASATVGLRLGGTASPFSFDRAALTAPRSITFEEVLPPVGSAQIAPRGPTSYHLSADVAGVPLHARALAHVLRPDDLVVSEVMASPPAALGEAGQWIELRSRAAFPVNLEGAVLQLDGDSATLPVLTLPSSGRLLLGASTNRSLNGDVDVAWAWSAPMALSPTAGAIGLSLRGAPLASLTFGAGVAVTPGASIVRDDVARALTESESFCAGATVYHAASSARGTPGQANDGCHYRVEAKADFHDISNTSRPPLLTSTTGATGTTATLAVPFAFNLFGQPCANLTVSRHGFVACGTALNSHPTNGALPATANPNGVLAPFWDEQLLLSTSRVLYDVFGTSPNQTLVVQWSHMDFVGTSGVDADLNYQLKLHESGDIELQYGGMSGGSAGEDRATGASATVGIEDIPGRIALPLLRDTAGAVHANTGVLFRKRP